MVDFMLLFRAQNFKLEINMPFYSIDQISDGICPMSVEGSISHKPLGNDRLLVCTNEKKL